MKRIIKVVGWIAYKIEEPRIVRVIQLALYITMTVMGALFLTDLPPNFEGILGVVIAIVFGCFITLGGLMGAVAILPAWWGIERAGIIFLWTGLAVYIVVVLILNGSPIGIAVAVGLALALLNRWIQEYLYQNDARVAR